MAYTPRNWADGELVTAEDLNRVEQGLADVSAKADQTAEIVDQIKHPTLVKGAPTGNAPAGTLVMDVLSGDVWEAGE